MADDTDVHLGPRGLYTSYMGVLMSELLFNILTAAFALLVTLGWLALITMLSVKYFEIRMKEKREASITQNSADNP